MDTRPYRPRGAENAVSSLHQRHKSTGTLTNIASNASTAGFRGPAKRAAFGDVTNLVKQVGTGRDDHKIVKVQSVAHISLSQAQGFKNKENHNKKDAHSRPSQRSTALTNKAKTFGENRAWEPLKSAEVPAVREAAVQIYKAEMGVASRPQLTDHVENNKRAQQSLDAAPLQPRHHKSQPQLKQQQPTLRRTQSRQLEKTDAPSFSMIDSELLGMCVPEEHELSGDEGFSEDLEVHTDNHSVEEVHDHGRWEESPPTLPDIAEEYRDEDDEDYDEQEQAYMTAHSLGGITTVLQPTVNTQVQSELERASLEVAQTRPQEDIEEEAWDVSMVAEYGEDIFKYMRELEVTMQPDPYYMDRQTEIQWSMRSVLMDWLVQVHNRFSLLPETLFLTVNYIDRFLSKKVVSIGKLQLVGATAILVASKYEEINCPSLQEIVYMVDNGYSVEEILKAERFMLSMLGFELGWPGPMSFLRRVSKADDYDLETRTLAKYFLELTIMDERFVSTPPSFLAAGAHCLSRLILEKGDWSILHVHYSGYTWSQLKSLVTMMIGCCEQPRLHHAAVFDKYSDRRFKEASTIVQDALDGGFTLPGCRLPVRRTQHYEDSH